MPTFIGTNPAPGGERRIIKRYSNRKLYDTRDSRYVTLLDLGELIRNGQDIQVIDKATEADKTDVTLALIIAEELKSGPRGIPLQTLRTLARERGERLIQQLRGGPIGRLIAREAERDPEAPDEGQVPQWTGDGVAQSSASQEPVANQDRILTPRKPTILFCHVMGLPSFFANRLQEVTGMTMNVNDFPLVIHDHSRGR